MVDAADRPFPPGEYPVLVIGSGPGGLQLSYGLRRHGVPHAVISADEGAGGMFRRWPFFQRLLSWTKPYAPAEKATREYQRYDWNSLLADEPELRAIQTEFLDGTSYFPSRPEMQANLEAFAARAGIAVRYGTRWERTRREDGPDGTTFVVETTDGEYRTQGARPRRGRRAAVQAHDARHRARRPLRGHPGCRLVRGPPGVHHRQAELRLRARDGARDVGLGDHRLLADARQDQHPDEVARRRAGPLCPAVRGQLPGPRRAGAGRLDRRPDPRRGRDPRRAPPHRQRRGAGGRGRRRDRGDRVHLPAPRPPGPGRGDVRREQAAGRRRRSGRAAACPGSSSRGRSGRRPRDCGGTASRPTRARSTAPATTR